MNEIVHQLGWFRRLRAEPVVFAPSLRGDDDHMRLALFAARAEDPSPNPPAGAVLASNGRIISVAGRERAGGMHAEMAVLHDAGLLSRGATLYVTLEPCNHQGRTAPCVDAILRAGIERVVIGCRDPNPHVRGGGAEKLARAGVSVVLRVLESRAKALIAPWERTLAQARLRRTNSTGCLLDGTFAEAGDA